MVYSNSCIHSNSLSITSSQHELGRVTNKIYEEDRNGPWRHRQYFDNEAYIAEGDPIYDFDSYNNSVGYLVFGMHYTMVLLIYTISDGSSLQYLEEIYDKIPKPPQPVNIVPHKIPNGYSGPRVRGIRLESLESEIKDYPAYVAMGTYPVVIAGYKGDDKLPRQVNKSDVDKFLSNHPNCVFGGEFALDNLEEIDDVFKVVIEVIHGLRETAIRDSPIQEENVETSQNNTRNDRKPFVQRLIHKITTFK